MSSLRQLLRGSADASPSLVLVVACAGVVLASLDLFIVNVALPQMAREFHSSGLGGVSWVLNGYAIVYAALLILFGRLAEGYRRDRAFLLGVAIFVAASAACGFAPTLLALVGFRVIQAAGAALLTPTSLGLLLATFEPQRRTWAVRAWSAVGGFAAALGPVVGGLLVGVSWRWVFFVNVPVGLAALALGWKRLPAVPGHPVMRPGVLGALLVIAGVGGLTLGLVEGSSWGWGSAPTLSALALAVGALALFALDCARGHRPLVERALFRVRPFTGASAVLLLFSMAFGAMLLSRVLWTEEVWGWSALLTGLSIVPGPAMVPLTSFLVAGRLQARFGAAPVIAVGAVIFAAGSLWWALAIGIRPDYLGDMLGGMLLTGVGVGLTLPASMATGVSSLPTSSFATGSAAVSTLRQVGLALGVALLVAILGAPHDPRASLEAYQRAWLMVAAVSLLSGTAGIALLRIGAARRVSSEGVAGEAGGELSSG